VFALEEPCPDKLPSGLPNTGLPVKALVGMASRDGMARALARQLSGRVAQ
jgi:hypothetical protein